MSANAEGTVSPEAATAAVDAVLARTGLPVSAAERERLIRFYPLVRDWMERLRMVEVRYAEPVLVYSATPQE